MHLALHLSFNPLSCLDTRNFFIVNEWSSRFGFVRFPEILVSIKLPSVSRINDTVVTSFAYLRASFNTTLKKLT